MRNEYQPHWVWFVAFVVAPLSLLLISVVGIEPGSLVPLGLAATAPGVALGLAASGMAAALLRRRKAPIQISAVGLSASLAGYLLHWWLSR
jgi:hypothetical protein